MERSPIYGGDEIIRGFPSLPLAAGRYYHIVARVLECFILFEQTRNNKRNIKGKKKLSF
jgi:hypothetical protein